MTEPTLSCSETIRALWDYVDNTLPSPLRDAVEHHLAGCDNCAGHVAFARRLVEALQTTPVDRAELERLEARVRHALAREAATSPA